MNRAVWLAAALAAVCAGGLRAQEEEPAPAAAAAPARRPAARRPPLLPDTARPPEYRREVFRYTGGARDPFASLLTTNDVGPTISDLRLVSITYDPRYGNSVAVLRAARDPHPIRLRRGDSVGRMRVIQIRQYSVVFRIEEFGFERQEELTLRRPEVNR